MAQYAFDDTSQYGKYLLDERLKIPKSHLQIVCKSGCGEKTCRYISLTVKGFLCVKNTPLRSKIDGLVQAARRGEGNFTAKGDNCEGMYAETEKDR
jgi:hypothetical protein